LTGASSLSRDAARPPTGGSRAAAGGDDAFFSVSGSAGSRAAIAALARAARGEDDDVVIAREARVRVLASAVASFVWFSNTEKKPFSSAQETSLSTSGRGGDSAVPLGLGHGADLDY
jgi:hypothetical protein